MRERREIGTPELNKGKLRNSPENCERRILGLYPRHHTLKSARLGNVHSVTVAVPTLAIWGSYIMAATWSWRALFPTWFFARISFAVDLLLSQNWFALGSSYFEKEEPQNQMSRSNFSWFSFWHLIVLEVPFVSRREPAQKGLEEV